MLTASTVSSHRNNLSEENTFCAHTPVHADLWSFLHLCSYPGWYWKSCLWWPLHNFSLFYSLSLSLGENTWHRDLEEKRFTLTVSVSLSSFDSHRKGPGRRQLLKSEGSGIQAEAGAWGDRSTLWPPLLTWSSLWKHTGYRGVSIQSLSQNLPKSARELWGLSM